MFKKCVASITGLAAAAALFLVVPTADAGGGGGSGFRIRARLNGAGTLASGKADYRERMIGANLQQRFNVEIEDAAADTTYEITINGSLFGTVTTNALGGGHLEFATLTVDDNPGDEHPPLPTDIQRLAAGMVVSIGPVSGAFR
ncbi:MAG: hypothetical protein ACT4PL_05670 [Phycisphaerales bacterium]